LNNLCGGIGRIVNDEDHLVFAKILSEQCRKVIGHALIDTATRRNDCHERFKVGSWFCDLLPKKSQISETTGQRSAAKVD
jgi:hypothetical protein